MRYIYLFVFMFLVGNVFCQDATNGADSLIDAANKLGTQNITKALELSKKAVALTENTNNLPLKVKAYRTLGAYYYLSANFGLAIANYQKALDLTTENN